MKQSIIHQPTPPLWGMRRLGLLAALLLMLLVPASLTYALPVPFAAQIIMPEENTVDKDFDVTSSTSEESDVDRTEQIKAAAAFCDDVTQIVQVECEALVALYNSTDGANWSNNYGWLNTTTPCSWHGVTCTGEHVEALSLAANGLNDNIPAELGNLTNLEYLNLAGNGISGSIPSALGNLTNLQSLNLGGNYLSGSIPAELGNLINLQILNLGVQFSNGLSGSIPLTLGNLTNLRTLDLSDNLLGGSIPPELGNLTNLQYLHLQSNSLNGSIPAELGQLSNLRVLNLSNNSLNGNLPEELGNLGSLLNLYLHNNYLSGSIPATLGNLPNLQYLYLANNYLSGSIPTELGNLGKLVEFRLQINSLSGSIPAQLGNLGRLLHLNLSDNDLSGEMPAQLGNLRSLRDFYLHDNDLAGSIPLSFVELDNVNVFHFYDTELCEPDDAGFQAWLEGVGNVMSTGLTCASPTNTPTPTPTATSSTVTPTPSNSPTPSSTPTATPPPNGLVPESAVANAGDLSVVIYGENFEEPLTARVGEVALLNVTIESANKLHAVLPVESLDEGVYDLIVESNGTVFTFPDAFTVTAAVSQTQFRAMVYLACDNNLTSSCKRLFNNLERAMGHNPDLRIVAFWDGYREGDSAYYLVQADDDSERWARYTDGVNRFPLGEVDSADSGTLVEFAAWAQSQYPGEYSFLSLVGHGEGWAPDLYPGQPMDYKWTGGVGGMLWDDHPNNGLLGDVMPTSRLADALAWISNGNQLDMIYLDACLMSTVEVMAEFAPYAQYFVAHENLGWAFYPYDQYFREVDSNTDPEALAQQIALSNRNFWPAKGHPAQISVINSSEMDNLLAHLDTLANELLTVLPDDGVRQAIEEVVRNTAHVDENHTEKWQINFEDSAIDLYHFAQQLNASSTIPQAVKSAAQELMTVFNATITFNDSYSETPWPGSVRWELDNLHGLSIYFPLYDEWKRAYYSSEALPRFANSTAWDDFIQAWYGEQRSPAPEPPTEPCSDCPMPPKHIALTLDTPDQAALQSPVSVPITLHGAEIADDVRAVQISVQVTDTTILIPDETLQPQIGDLFPSESLTYSVRTNEGWDFLLTAPLSPTEAISGTGVVVELPFYTLNSGCTWLTFNTHWLVDSAPDDINHHQQGAWLCTEDRGIVRGQAYLESRHAGAYDNILVTLTGTQGTFTTHTDAAGHYSLINLYEDNYNMTFEHPLFVARDVPDVSVSLGETTLPDVGLWAGDIDQDDDVELRDWNLLAAAIIPVDFPAFDINGDHETYIADQVILNRNLDRPGMTTTNPPRNEFGAEVRGQAEGATHLAPTDSQAGQHFTWPRQANQDTFTLRATNVTGTFDAIGTRIGLSAGATVSNVNLTGIFTGGFLEWEQKEDKLYIVAAPPEGQSSAQESDVVRIHITPPESEGTVTLQIEAVNKVGWQGDLGPLPGATYLLHLPLMQR